MAHFLILRAGKEAVLTAHNLDRSIKGLFVHAFPNKAAKTWAIAMKMPAHVGPETMGYQPINLVEGLPSQLHAEVLMLAIAKTPGLLLDQFTFEDRNGFLSVTIQNGGEAVSAELPNPPPV